MKQYLDLARTVLDQGSFKKNRTRVPAYSLPGMSLRFNMQDGFPALTTRKMAFKSSVGEIVGFLRSAKSAADFRSLGCKFWDLNANNNDEWLNNLHRQGHDDLGEIYGVQWRKWPAFRRILKNDLKEIQKAEEEGFVKISETDDSKEFIFYKEIDQVRECLDLIMHNPNNRRILFHAWNPAELNRMSLVPCHHSYNFTADVDKKELSLTLYIRSSDIGLGLPANMITSGALLSLFARLTGYTPKWLSIMIGDAHVYADQIEMIETQEQREQFALPEFKISDRVPNYAETGVYQPEWLDLVEPGDFSLENYKCHPPLTAPMAV